MEFNANVVLNAQICLSNYTLAMDNEQFDHLSCFSQPSFFIDVFSWWLMVFCNWDIFYYISPNYGYKFYRIPYHNNRQHIIREPNLKNYSIFIPNPIIHLRSRFTFFLSISSTLCLAMHESSNYWINSFEIFFSSSNWFI